jgi:hypothetical protein
MKEYDTETRGLLRDNDLDEDPTIARLKNIKRLADSVFDKSKAVATNLNKDTEGLQSALDKVRTVVYAE